MVSHLRNAGLSRTFRRGLEIANSHAQRRPLLDSELLTQESGIPSVGNKEIFALRFFVNAYWYCEVV